MKKVCVDVDPRTKKRDPLVKVYKITGVPCILHNKHKYSGDVAFDFLEKITNQSNEPAPQQPPQQQQPKVKEFSLDMNNSAFSAFNFEGDTNPEIPSGHALFGEPTSIIIDESIKDGSKKNIASDYERMMLERDKEIIPIKRI